MFVCAKLRETKCLDLAPYYRVFNLFIDKTITEINLDHTINIQQDRAHHWRFIWYRQGASLGIPEQRDQ